MGSVIGDLLPVAAGIAITPAAIVTAVVLLLSSRARTTSVAFLAGWVGGIAVSVTFFVLLAAGIPAPTDDGSAPVAGTVKIALGLGLVVLVLRKRSRRAASGDVGGTPAWMAALDSLTGGRAAGLGLLLSLANPMNLLLAAGAGITIGSAQLGVGEAAVTATVFVLLAASSVLVPVVAFLTAESRIAPHLADLRTWLTGHNEVITSVLLLVLGTVLIGNGIGSY